MDLAERIRRGREAIRKAQAEGRDVSEWQEHLRKLEAELAHQAEATEISRLMAVSGYAIVWSEILGETIAFARDDAAAAQVPGGIVCYTRSELEKVIGTGADTLRLIHEGKKHGARVTGRSKADGR